MSKIKKNHSNTEFEDKALLVLLEQSLLHWRHIENARQGFTSVWAAIVAGVLAFIAQTPNFLSSPATVPALLFLILLTAIGFLMSVRLGYNIKPCEENVENILQKENLENYNLVKGWEKSITKHFRLRRIYNLLFIITLIFLISLLTINILGSIQKVEIIIKLS